MHTPQAPCWAIRNGIRRPNVHLSEFDAMRNDLSARFNNIMHRYSALNSLMEGITQYLTGLQHGPSCRLFMSFKNMMQHLKRLQMVLTMQ
jgi:hypothetical protein